MMSVKKKKEIYDNRTRSMQVTFSVNEHLIRFDMSLLDLIVALRPTMSIQRRALEGRFLNRTLLYDILWHPLEVYEDMQLAPGIGQKTRGEIAAVITEAFFAIRACDELNRFNDALLEVDHVFSSCAQG